MTEIEKLYRNAGIGYLTYVVDTFPPVEYSQIDFTAEKQILLIQWLLDKTDLYLHRHKTNFTYSIASGDTAVNKYKDFKESIAEFINAIWQDLTENERQQIKEILNG